VILASPEDTPVTTPVVGATVAIPVSPEVHVPPATELPSVTDAASHTACGPENGAGDCSTLIAAVLAGALTQPATEVTRTLYAPDDATEAGICVVELPVVVAEYDEGPLHVYDTTLPDVLPAVKVSVEFAHIVVADVDIDATDGVA